MYIGYINDTTAQIERSCREIRECASKFVETAPSASTNTASLQIAAKEAVDCWKAANKVDFVDFAIRMNRLEAALLLQA
jgi:hypothetical protein